VHTPLLGLYVLQEALTLMHLPSAPL